MSKVNRKRKVLTIDDKVAIIKELEISSNRVIADKYGVGKSTISDIKKNKEKILAFQREMSDMGMQKKAKIMQVGDDVQHDKAVFLWFKQKRIKGIPISGPILCEKAVQLHKKLYGDQSQFTGSTGWQWRFCKCHGIRNLSLQGEKLSADKVASDNFIASFAEFIEQHHLTLNQIFNCDETGLNFRLLPDKTLASSFEKSADGRKKSKERVTINACANATGSIKLPLQVIGTAKRPRCFRGVQMDLLPVEYQGQKNAWMSTEIFHTWFHESFVPTVRRELALLGLEQKAVLVLDNCPAHPNVKDLVSDDGKITAHYLPPNVTSLIQPMDQGVLEALKRRYKKKIRRRLLIEEENGQSIVAFLKSVDMKVVAELIAESWDEVQASTIQKSWRKIIASRSDQGEERSEDETSSGGVDTVEQSSEDDGSSVDVREFVHVDSFQELGYSMNEDDISTWLRSDRNDPGFHIMSEDEICDYVSSEVDHQEDEDDSETEQHSTCPITNSQAAHMFEKCLTWLEYQPEANECNVCTLRQLRALAARKREHSLKQTALKDMLPLVANEH